MPGHSAQSGSESVYRARCRARPLATRRTREPDHAHQQQKQQRRCKEDIVGREHECLLIDELIQQRAVLAGAKSANLQTGDDLRRRLIRKCQMFDEASVMKRRTPIPERGYDRSAEGAGVMRAKLNSPEAAGMRSGDSPDSDSVTSGTKKQAIAAP